jgi:hypothetical protein
MEPLFDLLSTLKFRHRLFNVGDARKSLLAKPPLLHPPPFPDFSPAIETAAAVIHRQPCTCLWYCFLLLIFMAIPAIRVIPGFHGITPVPSSVNTLWSTKSAQEQSNRNEIARKIAPACLMCLQFVPKFLLHRPLIAPDFRLRFPVRLDIQSVLG